MDWCTTTPTVSVTATFTVAVTLIVTATYAVASLITMKSEEDGRNQLKPKLKYLHPSNIPLFRSKSKYIQH